MLTPTQPPPKKNTIAGRSSTPLRSRRFHQAEEGGGWGTWMGSSRLGLARGGGGAGRVAAVDVVGADGGAGQEEVEVQLVLRLAVLDELRPCRGRSTLASAGGGVGSGEWARGTVPVRVEVDRIVARGLVRPNVVAQQLQAARHGGHRCPRVQAGAHAAAESENAIRRRRRSALNSIPWRPPRQTRLPLRPC